MFVWSFMLIGLMEYELWLKHAAPIRPLRHHSVPMYKRCSKWVHSQSYAEHWLARCYSTTQSQTYDEHQKASIGAIRMKVHTNVHNSRSIHRIIKIKGIMKSVEYSLCIEYTHLLTKVKQRQAWLVLGWVTTCEYHNPHLKWLYIFGARIVTDTGSALSDSQQNTLLGQWKIFIQVLSSFLRQRR